MKGVLDRLDFTPRRLAAAVERAIELHPGTALAPTPLPAEGLGALRGRVAAAGGERDRLDQLARELSPREVRGLVTGLEQWEELRASVAHLVLARAQASLVPPLWRAWQRFPSVDAVRSTLILLAERFGWREAAGEPYAALVAGWVGASAPGVEIQGWLDGLGKSVSDLPGLSACPLAPETPLLKLVRDAVLTHGSSRQLRTEGTRSLLAWSKELAPPQRVLFGRNYLSRIPIDEWDWPALELIERSYGLPKRPRLPQFWHPLPETIRAAFQRHFIRQRLREAFHDDTDRFAYWTRWEDAFHDIQIGKAGDTGYAALRFDRFGAVEFFQVGHAAHFYPEQDLDRILAKRIYAPHDLKERDDLALDGRGNRLIHSPAGGWYGKADRMVNRWIAHTR